MFPSLRPLDVEFMKALHEKVNIVPVLAKADTLTPSEVKKKKMKAGEKTVINTFKSYKAKQSWLHLFHTPVPLQIREEIEQYGIKIYQFPDCDSDEDEEFKQQDLELKVRLGEVSIWWPKMSPFLLFLAVSYRYFVHNVDFWSPKIFDLRWSFLSLFKRKHFFFCSSLQESIPFAVIGSNTVVEAKGKRVRGRLYPWGIVEGWSIKYRSNGNLNSKSHHWHSSCMFLCLTSFF